MQNDIYRITLAVRDSSTHKLIEERLITDGITDINDMSYKFHLALKAFEKADTSEIDKKPGCNYSGCESVRNIDLDGLLPTIECFPGRIV